ncbi:MAG: flagellar biosynthetic protein FliR [Gammaproteobacteria bacterium]
MLVTSAEIASWVGGLLWPLARIGALVSVAPVYGSRTLPVRARLLLALALTWAVWPLLEAAPTVEPLSPAGFLILAQQVLIGFAVGFLLRLAFAALEISGQIVATQMGLSFASLVDPQAGGQMPLLGQFFQLTGTLIFLSLNGHLLLIQLLAESFVALPVGGAGLAPANLWNLARAAGWMFAGALAIALPALVSLLVVNLAFSVISRAAPQLNLFAVGFPVTLILGLLILLYSLPALLPQFSRLLDGAFGGARGLLF